jgi:DNA polymerase-3 subunit beta
MKYTGSKEDIHKAISQVSRVISTRGTLPILRNIYLEATKTGLLCKATDLEQTVEVGIDGVVAEPGTVTVPARLLVDYLQNSTEKEITLSATDTDLTISGKSGTAHLKGMPASEYPSVPPIVVDQEFRLPVATLRQALDRCLFAAAVDDSRPVLSGLLFRFTDKQLTLVATDGYRLALEGIGLPTQFTGDYVIPRRALAEVSRLLTGDEVVVRFSASQACFIIGSVTFMSRTLDGAFPAYEAIIPKSSTLKLILDAGALLQSLRLVSLFSRDSAYSVKLHFEGQKLQISATSSQFGDSSQEVVLKEAVKEPFSITLNAQYLIDVLTAIAAPVELSCLDPQSALVVKSPELADYTYLLMPLRGE